MVPLLLSEARTARLESLLKADPEPVVWWASPVECQSALYRRHRESPIPFTALREAETRIAAFFEDVDAVGATLDLRRRAGRLLALHPLRAADALQLAAALMWCAERPSGEDFVCLDERLREAARREGFTVLPS